MKAIKKDEAKRILMVGETYFYELLKLFPTMKIRQGIFDAEKVKSVFETLNQHGGVKRLLKARDGNG